MKKNSDGIKGLSEAEVDKTCKAAKKLVNAGSDTAVQETSTT